MGEETKTVQMTAEEAAQYEAFKAEQAKKNAAEQAKKDREAYAQLVDETIETAIPELQRLSKLIKATKGAVLDRFSAALDMKADVLKKTKDGQKTHTFTTANGDKRITVGHYITDGWRDTVEDGIEKVRDSVTGLINDDKTKALVNQILRLLSRDQQGNLKANKVLALEKLAAELNIEELNDGIAIIKEARIENVSKTFIRAEYKDKRGIWRYIPLSVTEADETAEDMEVEPDVPAGA